MVYPYKTRVADPIEIDIWKKWSKFRAIETKNGNISKRIGHKIPRIIKEDGVYIRNNVLAITNPRIKLEFKPAQGKKGIDFIFKSIF